CASLPMLLSHKTISHPPIHTLFPYTTLFRSEHNDDRSENGQDGEEGQDRARGDGGARRLEGEVHGTGKTAVGSLLVHEGLKNARSEEHTSELQSRENLECRLLLEKKNIT